MQCDFFLIGMYNYVYMSNSRLRERDKKIKILLITTTAKCKICNSEIKPVLEFVHNKVS